MQVSIVLTTINIPEVIEDYIKNFIHYDQQNVNFIVIGDRKSPNSTKEYLNSLSHYNYDIIYLGISEQKKWLSTFPEFSNYLPFDSVQRRNIGYLYAAEIGAEIIISIDDDNFPLIDYDYIGNHSIVGTTDSHNTVFSSTGWFNTCSLLRSQPNKAFYHRGFPICERWQNEKLHYKINTKRIVVNIGLWLGDPDVDTITRLEEPFDVINVINPNERLLLSTGLMAPFNTQNTAFSTAILPVLYLITFESKFQNEFLRGNNNFRYDDIWMSYFAKLVIDHLKDGVCVGPPHVNQQRNEHDYLLDLRKEMNPMELTNKLIKIFPQIELTKNNYLDTYYELIIELKRITKIESIFTNEEKNIINEMCLGMELWTEVVSKI